MGIKYSLTTDGWINKIKQIQKCHLALDRYNSFNNSHIDLQKTDFFWDMNNYDWFANC